METVSECSLANYVVRSKPSNRTTTTKLSGKSRTDT
ncbi:hypothetical protein QE392_002611 [Microbacterium proteolyticum]|nr:hypothetical protein [Microbacterium sp. SORGH_AS_0344]MDQ1170807.1 hypothetical protein [Microbacterium proteolyticum]